MNHKSVAKAAMDKEFVKQFVHPLMDDIVIDIEHTFERDAATTVLDWVEEWFAPEEVFDDDALEEWANRNGYVKA